jgi:hypothetical protein
VLFGSLSKEVTGNRSSSTGFGACSDDHARKSDLFDVTEVSSLPIANADT